MAPSRPAKRAQLAPNGRQAIEQRGWQNVKRGRYRRQATTPYYNDAKFERKRGKRVIELVVRGLPMDPRPLVKLNFPDLPHYMQDMLSNLPARNTTLFQWWYDREGLTPTELAHYMVCILQAELDFHNC